MIVAGEQFAAAAAAAAAPQPKARRRVFLGRPAFFVYGLLLALASMWLVRQQMPWLRPAAPAVRISGTQTFVVGAGGSFKTIAEAMDQGPGRAIPWRWPAANTARPSG